MCSIDVLLLHTGSDVQKQSCNYISWPQVSPKRAQQTAQKPRRFPSTSRCVSLKITRKNKYSLKGFVFDFVSMNKFHEKFDALPWNFRATFEGHRRPLASLIPWLFIFLKTFCSGIDDSRRTNVKVWSTFCRAQCPIFGFMTKHHPSRSHSIFCSDWFVF